MVAAVNTFCLELLDFIRHSQTNNTVCDLSVRTECFASEFELIKLLHKYSSSKNQLSKQTLQPFIVFLAQRFQAIQETNGSYFGKCRKSKINVICILMAKKIGEILNEHYYHFLIPTLDKLSKKMLAEISQLQLHEMVLDDAGFPIDVRKCLDQAFETNQLTFYHPLFKTKLSKTEVERVINHSLAAFYYYDLIEYNVTRCRLADTSNQKKFYESLACESDYNIRYQYPNSDEKLLRYAFQFFKKNDFFTILQKLFLSPEWPSFFDLFKNLPLKSWLFSHQDLIKEVNNDLNYHNDERFVRGVFFTWIHLYWQDRIQQGETKSMTAWAGHQTENLIGGKWFFNQTKYWLGGVTLEEKKEAVEVLMNFLIQDEFSLTELDQYLAHIHKEHCRTALFDHDLGMIVNKMLEVATLYKFPNRHEQAMKGKNTQHI